MHCFYFYLKTTKMNLRGFVATQDCEEKKDKTVFWISVQTSFCCSCINGAQFEEALKTGLPKKEQRKL